MEELLSQSHLPKPCLDTIVESSQCFEAHQQPNENSILVTSSQVSKIECSTTQHTSCTLLSGLKQDDFSSIGPTEKEKENRMSVEDLQQDQPAEEAPTDHMIEEKLEKEANTPNKVDIKENPIQDSTIDQINPEEVKNIVDEILEDNRPSKDNEKREASWRILKRLKKQEVDKSDFEEEEEHYAVSEKEMDEYVEEEPQRKSHLKKQQMHSYSELLTTMQYLSKHDWLDESPLHQKLTSSNYLTANVIWFMICAKFFQRAAFAHKNPKEFCMQRIDKVKTFIPDIPERITKSDIKNEIIQKSSLTENESIFINNLRKAIKTTSTAYTTNDYLKKTMSSRTIKSVPKTMYNSEDDEWIMETRHYLYDRFNFFKETNAFEGVELEFPKNLDIMAKIDLQDLITLYEKDLYESALDNEKLLESLEKNVIATLEEEERFNSLKIDPDSNIVDLMVNFPEDEQYIALLEKKLNESKDPTKISLPESTIGKSAGNKRASQFQPKLLIDDMVCYVCNDGDYTDDDLIVFCSKCNMSVHQRCYGIPVIPKGDWICNVCLNFGPNGKCLRCPLCDKRGGALKPTCIRADSDLFEYLNPSYHAFLKSYASEDFLKNAPKTLFATDVISGDAQELNKDDDTKATTNDDSDSNFSENLYYDIQFLNDKFTEEDLANEPRPLNVWVHMSCAVFIPELYFDDEDYIFNVLALETIPKERFKYDCEICGKKRNGAIVNCGKGNCKRSFHPECARRAQYFLDIRENEANQLIYHIFCEKHTPLKLKRDLESREKKMREEIQQFFKLVDKCRTNALMTANQQIMPLPETNLLPNAERKIRKQEKKENADNFMSLVLKYKEMTSVDALALPNEQLDSTDNNEPSEPVPKPNLALDRKLKAHDPIWNLIPYKNFTAEEKYRKYKKIMKKQKEKKDNKESRIEICRRNAERAREAKKMQYQQKQAQKDQVVGPEPKQEPKQKQKASASANANEKPKASSKSVEKEKEIIIKTKTTRTEEKEDKNKLYCLCRKKFKGELMTACEGCEEWFHPACLGLKMPRNQLKRIKWWCRKCSTEKGFEGLELYIEDQADVYVKRIGSGIIEKDEPALLKKVKINEEMDSQKA